MSFHTIDLQLDVDEDIGAAIVAPIFKHNDIEKTAKYLHTLGIQAIFSAKDDHLQIECKPIKRLKLGIQTEVSQNDTTIGANVQWQHVRHRLDNLSFQANVGRATKGLFELKYTIPLVSNLFRKISHGFKFGHNEFPLPCNEQTWHSTLNVQHESQPLQYQVGPTISKRNEHVVGGLSHEIVYDSRTSALSLRGCQMRLSQMINMWQGGFVKTSIFISKCLSWRQMVSWIHIDIDDQWSNESSQHYYREAIA